MRTAAQLDDDDDEDMLSPAERAEALAMFKRGRWRGPSPLSIIEAGRMRQARAEGTSTPAESPRARGIAAKSIFDEPIRHGSNITVGDVGLGMSMIVGGYLLGRWWSKYFKVTAPKHTVRGDGSDNPYVVGGYALGAS